MNTLLTIFTIAFIPFYGIYMFNQGRKLEREITDKKLSNLVNNIKAKRKEYETRHEEVNRYN